MRTCILLTLQSNVLIIFLKQVMHGASDCSKVNIANSSAERSVGHTRVVCTVFSPSIPESTFILYLLYWKEWTWAWMHSEENSVVGFCVCFFFFFLKPERDLLHCWSAGRDKNPRTAVEWGNWEELTDSCHCGGFLLSVLAGDKQVFITEKNIYI